MRAGVLSTCPFFQHCKPTTHVERDIAISQVDRALYFLATDFCKDARERGE